jgi:hypothetical protein
MAIVGVSEVAGRTFESDERGYVDGSRKWVVKSNVLNEWPVAIAAAVGVNQYDPHPAYPNTIARLLKMSQRSPDANIWDVEIPYSDKPFDAQQQPTDLPGGGTQQSPSATAADQPEARPVIWTFTRKEVMKVLEVDAIDGTPILNTNGLPFETPIEVPRSHMIVRIEFLKASMSLSEMRSYWDIVNNAAWKGFPKWTVKCNDFNTKTTFEKVGSSGMAGYFSCALELEYNPEAWQPKKILAQSSKVKKYIGNGTFRIDTATINGQPAVVPLAQNGTRLEDGQQLYYVEVRPFREMNFTEKFF